MTRHGENKTEGHFLTELQKIAISRVFFNFSNDNCLIHFLRVVGTWQQDKWNSNNHTGRTKNQGYVFEVKNRYSSVYLYGMNRPGSMQKTICTSINNFFQKNARIA